METLFDGFNKLALWISLHPEVRSRHCSDWSSCFSKADMFELDSKLPPPSHVFMKFALTYSLEMTDY